MTVAREKKPEARAAFAKSVKALRQNDHTWEADYRALPKPLMQSETHYLGLVVQEDGSVLAQSQVEGRPTANDLATLLTASMLRPQIGQTHRPHRPPITSRNAIRPPCPTRARTAVANGSRPAPPSRTRPRSRVSP